MLKALSWLYGQVVALRNRLYTKGYFRSRKLPARTIAVGNITVGGTGKTPLVAYIAEALFGQGETICIISRGYKRSNESERVLVSDGTTVLANARESGDEPYELAKRLLGKASVICDRNRVAAAEWAYDRLRPTVFLLDDAFQHRRAKRDLDIAVIDTTNPFGTGFPLPVGTLREIPEGLARADAIVLSRVDLCSDIDAIEQQVRQFAPHVPLFRCTGVFTRFILLHKFAAAESQSSSEFDQPVFAFCGLGNPDNFFRQITAAGIKVAGKHAFPDHHKYTKTDIRLVESEAIACRSRSILTTAKDAVKLDPSDHEIPCYVCENTIRFENEKSFAELISKAQKT